MIKNNIDSLIDWNRIVSLVRWSMASYKFPDIARCSIALVIDFIDTPIVFGVWI